MSDPRLPAIPDIHGHAKGEHKRFAEERPIPYHARLIFLWFYHAANRRSPRFVMISDHVNYLTFEDPAAVALVRRALKLALAGDLYGASETAKVDMHHAKVVSEAMRAGMRFSIGAEVDNDPRSRPDAQNVIDAMKPDGIIRSVHFLPITHPDTGEEWMWPFDNPEFKQFFEIVGVEETWQLYADLMVDAVKTLPGDILGHLHVPGKFGHWPEESILEGHENRILDACAERGMGIEINTRVFYRSSDPAVHARHLELYRRLLRKCVERDLPIAIGSDAHSPRDQGAGIEKVLPLLDELDINEIVFPINGTLARVALRGDRPIKSRPSVVIQPARQAIAMEQDADSVGESAATAEALATAPPATGTVTVAAPVAATPQPEPAVAAVSAAAHTQVLAVAETEVQVSESVPAVAATISKAPAKKAKPAAKPDETKQDAVILKPAAAKPTTADVPAPKVATAKAKPAAEAAKKPAVKKPAAKAAPKSSPSEVASKPKAAAAPKKKAPAKSAASASAPAKTAPKKSPIAKKKAT